MLWQFNRMNRGDMNTDPNEGEFFATETLGSIVDALVREAIQNSLDAMAEESIRVRFRLGEAGDQARDRYLRELWPHVEAAVRETGQSLPLRNEPLRYLVVEDEGTRGLEGAPAQDEDDGEEGSRNDFYYFWRNVGRSRKQSTDRGRWGLGKTVFAVASRIHAFFGLTKRRSDSRTLLMGQAVLRIHKVQNRRYRPYGYYGHHDDNFALPIDDRQSCDEFAQCFGLQRRAPGLSVVIPYPDEEIEFERLLESVLRHYFHPLLAGKLVVEVQDEDETCRLDADNLEEEIRNRGQLRELHPVIELARWGLNLDGDAIPRLAAPPAGHAPRLTEDLFDAADLEVLRRSYDDGERIALEVPLWIEAKDRPRSQARFHLFLERDQHHQRGEGFFVRQGITIENPKARRPRGVRWILVADDPVLSAFLGDAENPAHTEWQRSSPKFKEKYRLGPSTLDFVRSAPANVVALLSRPTEGRDPDLLRHIFSVASEATGPFRQRSGSPGRGNNLDTLEESIPATLGGNGSLVLEKVGAGFRLRGEVGEDGPRRLEVLVAYDVLRGNPFLRYSPYDFRMDQSLAVETQGVRLVSRNDNRLELEIEDPQFQVLVTGFDEHRDLRVKVRRLEETG